MEPPTDLNEINNQIFDWLYTKFIEDSNNELEIAKNFKNEINKIFEEYGNSTKIRLNERLTRNNQEIGDYELFDKDNVFSTELLISLIDFIFNFNYGTPLKLAPVVIEFNSFSEDEGSNIRIIPYIGKYEAIETRKTSKKLT